MQKLFPIGYQKQNAQLVGIDPKEKNVLINIIKDKNLTMVPFFMLPMQQSIYSPTLQILDSPDDCKHSHNIQTNFSLTFNLMALFPTLMGQTDL